MVRLADKSSDHVPKLGNDNKPDDGCESDRLLLLKVTQEVDSSISFGLIGFALKRSRRIITATVSPSGKDFP